MRALWRMADIFAEKCLVLVATACACAIIVRKGGDDVETVEIELEQQEMTFGDAVISLYRIKGGSDDVQQDYLHRHSFYELQLLLRGAYDYVIDDRTIHVAGGEMVIIGSEVCHRAVVDDGLQRVVLSITVKKRQNGEMVFDQLTKCLEKNLHRAISISRDLAERIAAFDRVAVARSGMAVLHRKLDACTIVVGIFDAMGYGNAGNAAPQGVDFDIALEAFVEHSGATMKQIAESLGYSQRHIARKIKARYGKSLTQIRREKYETSGSHI